MGRQVTGFGVASPDPAGLCKRSLQAVCRRSQISTCGSALSVGKASTTSSLGEGVDLADFGFGGLDAWAGTQRQSENGSALMLVEDGRISRTI